MTLKNNLILLSSMLLTSCYTSYRFSSSEKDAEIFVNNKSYGIGQDVICNVKDRECVTVRVEKQGFLSNESKYCYDGMTFNNPQLVTISLKEDDSFMSSIQSDFANKDFEQQVSSKLTPEESWKIVSQVVTSYFDNLEMADQLTGYMKTSWQVKTFSNKTIRTRIIVKQSGIEPLKYKIKIVSEYSDNPNESVKNDDRFKEWDRILRTYNELINEFQSRLGGK